MKREARPEAGTSRRGAATDCLVLAALVLLSAAPYVRALGLYSDDWAFLAALHGAGGSYGELVASLMPHGLATRPVQAFVLAGLYALFGTEPLGWHVVNAFVLATSVVLFYLSLRALGVSRLAAAVAPLLFGLLPHYSTDRFWIASFQANVGVLLYFVSLYADLRFVTGRGRSAWLWKALGTVALVGSVLAYEVTGPLLVLNVAVLWYAAGARPGAGWTRHVTSKTLTVASNILFLALAIAYKMTTTVRADVAGGYRYRLLRIVQEAVPVHFGELGLALPLKVGRALRDYPDAAVLGVSAAVGLAASAYVLRLTRSGALVTGRPTWPVVIGLGLVVFAVGNGLTLMTWEIGFHSTGPNNRTAIGAAIGVAIVFAGVIGWISTRLSADRLQRAAFVSLVGLLAGSCTLLTNTVAGFWVRSVEQQEDVIQSIRQRFPTLPPGSALLLDGLCPFHGPAPVFATGWDVTGMLHLTYGDLTLKGDVVKPNTEATPAGLRTMLFDDVINVYPYDDDLIVFHLLTGEAVRLTSEEEARAYLEGVSAATRAPCPPYTDGDGVPIL
jgi:hypothetical protein